MACSTVKFNKVFDLLFQTSATRRCTPYGYTICLSVKPIGRLLVICSHLYSRFLHHPATISTTIGWYGFHSDELHDVRCTCGWAKHQFNSRNRFVSSLAVSKIQCYRIHAYHPMRRRSQGDSKKKENEKNDNEIHANRGFFIGFWLHAASLASFQCCIWRRYMCFVLRAFVLKWIRSCRT